MTATAPAPAPRLRRLVFEASVALQEIGWADLDVARRRAALEALRELWTVACEAGDPCYFAKLARHLADEHGLGEPAALYLNLTEVELLDLHTARRLFR